MSIEPARSSRSWAVWALAPVVTGVLALVMWRTGQDDGDIVLVLGASPSMLAPAVAAVTGVLAVIALGRLGAWLLRRRPRSAGPAVAGVVALLLAVAAAVPTLYLGFVAAFCFSLPGEDHRFTATDGTQMLVQVSLQESTHVTFYRRTGAFTWTPVGPAGGLYGVAEPGCRATADATTITLACPTRGTTRVSR